MIKESIYLLLVSFFSPTVDNLQEVEFSNINNSPYHGISIKLTDPYSDQATPTITDTSLNKLKSIKQEAWVWVYFNRFCGYDTRKRRRANKDFFKRIKGLDIYNEQGALKYIYSDWDTALKTAKKLNSPGIIVDPELYNDPASYNVRFVAEKQGTSPQKTIKILRLIGKELADRTHKEYPTAHILFLLTWLAGDGRERRIARTGYAPTVSYIVEGLLQRAASKKYQFEIITGGESSLNYCYRSINDTNNLISNRNYDYQQSLDKFPNLRLGGVVAPWTDKNWKTKARWRKKKRCSKSEFNEAKDFKPVFQTLFHEYPYVWIYAAKGLDYDPFLKEKSISIHKTLSEALKDF